MRQPAPIGARRLRSSWFVAGVAVALAFGCRGQPSAEPPMRIVKDMTHQSKALTYSLAAQRAANGGIVGQVGVVATEQARDDADAVYGNRQGYLERIPIEVDSAMIERGRQRFGVYCVACHDEAGSGQGIIAQKGFPSPVDLARPNAVRMPDGQLFEVITRGIRNMPAPGEQIEVRDRWSIVAWVRVLQRSRNAVIADVGAERISTILPEQAAQ